MSGVWHSNPIQPATVVITAPIRYSALVSCVVLQLQNWRAPKQSATFVHKSHIQLLRYLLIFQLGRSWWSGCSQLCQVYKSMNQKGTTEQLCSSGLPWRVKPPSYDSACVYKLSCRIYVTDALSPTKQLPTLIHLAGFMWWQD
jgi:hypothetical protein